MSSIDDSEIISKVDAYYTGKVIEHGPTHRGVDWNSDESQALRFEQLLKIVDGEGPFSITDVGCGYGALALALVEQKLDFRYLGFDVSSAMVEHARRLLAAYPQCTVSTEAAGREVTDYAVASGIFSVRMDVQEDKWLRYCLDTIDVLARSSSRGFAFNMLTGYSDPERMRQNLYYADPHFIFDHCRTRYSRRVALLHDYPIYEFTVLVRL
jgi:hypothetical protein